MSELPCADYSQGLRGKSVRQVLWLDGDDHGLSIRFTDGTVAIFRLTMKIEEQVVLGDFDGRKIVNERPVVAMPVRLKPPPLKTVKNSSVNE
jgi:hypothetical protein